MNIRIHQSMSVFTLEDSTSCEYFDPELYSDLEFPLPAPLEDLLHFGSSLLSRGVTGSRYGSGRGLLTILACDGNIVYSYKATKFFNK